MKVGIPPLASAALGDLVGQGFRWGGALLARSNAVSSVYSLAGTPPNSLGKNGDWALCADGHAYFKAAGAWGLKV